jgi:hypothetical protein
MYFPQILLFNSIKNPNLIYPGSTLRIPMAQNKDNYSEQVESKHVDASHNLIPSEDKKITGKPAASSTLRQTSDSSSASPATTEISLSDLKTVGAGKLSICSTSLIDTDCCA